MSKASAGPGTSMLDDVSLPEHHERVERRWAALRAREVAERNPNPTRLRIPVLTQP